MTRVSHAVRAATVSDAAALHALTQRAFAETRAWPAPSSVLEEPDAALCGALEAGTTEARAVWDGDRPIGCVRFCVEGDGLTFFRLAVDPDRRGEGIAGALLDDLEAEALRRGLCALRCCVRTEVARNVALYAARGFETVHQTTVPRHGREVPTASLEKRLARTGVP